MNWKTIAFACPARNKRCTSGALASAGALPNNFGDSLKHMLEKSASPLLNRRQQEEMSKIALQEELTRIISSMPGIESACVLYNVENQQGFNPRKQITASVNVKPQGKQLLTARQVQMIRQAVGPPIGALPESVAVIDFNGASYPAGSDDGESVSMSHRDFQTKEELERDYRERITEALRPIIDGAVVKVSIETNESANHAGDCAPAKSDSRAVKSREPNASSDGESGRSNQPAVVKTLVDALTADIPKAESAPEPAPVKVEMHQNTPAAAIVKSISVSIGIPADCYRMIWQDHRAAGSNHEIKNPSDLEPNAADLQQIEADVCASARQQVLETLSTSGAYPQTARLITITTLPGSCSSAGPHVSATPIAPQRAQVDDEIWLRAHSAEVLCSVFVLGCALVVYSAMKSASRKRRAAPALKVVPADDEPIEADARREAVSRGGLQPHGGPSLRDELADIVRDDPEVAANVLRNWIASAS